MVPSGRAAQPGGRGPEPSVHRGGEVYGSAAQVTPDALHDSGGLHRSGDIYDSGDIFQSGDIHRSGEIYGSGAGGGVYGSSGGGDQGGKRRADVTAVDLGYTGRRSRPDPAEPDAVGGEPDEDDEGYYGNGNYWEAGGFGGLEEGYPGWTEAEERHGKNW